jgi:redox-sensitive bicupin YhaK (pirin superfamily)
VIDVRRAGERFTTTAAGLLTRHSFSFGAHYDPANVGLAVLVAHNDDRVAPGAGYDTHPHQDLEIVTWVLEGSLVHQDSAGRTAVARPGFAHRLSAGRGVLHSERNDAPGADAPTRFVQMWLRPDEPGLAPSYEQREVDACSGLVAVVSGVPGLDGAARLPIAGAALLVARLAPGESALLPDAAHLHVFVARGAVQLEGAGGLEEGDAARFSGEGGPRLTGTAGGGGQRAEVLVWRLPSR